MGKGGDCCRCDLDLPSIEELILKRTGSSGGSEAPEWTDASAAGEDQPANANTEGLPRQDEASLPELPCCPVHENLLRAGKLKPFDNCIVCTRNHRDELAELLTEAERLLKRGVKALNRLGWEKGETDAEWRQAARAFLTGLKMARDYEKTKEMP